MLSVLQCEQGNWAHLFVLEFAPLAYGHAAFSLIVMIAGDTETQVFIVMDTTDDAVRIGNDSQSTKGDEGEQGEDRHDEFPSCVIFLFSIFIKCFLIFPLF